MITAPAPIETDDTSISAITRPSRPPTPSTAIGMSDVWLGAAGYQPRETTSRWRSSCTRPRRLSLPLHSSLSDAVAPGDARLVMRCTSFRSRDASRGWSTRAVSYTHLRAHETRHDLVCRLLLEKKKKQQRIIKRKKKKKERNKL